ncbi:hypothetical protein BJ912DRAFT_944266 [Pholiota molesta]|nr:hypothetical protein BJ912DRAFT_944266 [Pholiota molesta]
MDFISGLVSFFPLKSSAATEEDIIPISVNYFPHRQCNYSCQFCFHTSTNLSILPMKKLNISGGEPFLKPAFIGEIFRFCKEELHLESCSVVNNGSKVTEKWLDTYGQYLDVMAISCDSFDAETNTRIGRSDKARKGDHISRVFERGIQVKINTVVNKHNWQEDMNDNIASLGPSRWKVFQVLLLDGENTGDKSNSLRDGRDLVITDEQFQAFLDRHKAQKSLVPEDNEAMKDSYLNLDEEMRFLNCETGGKVPGQSLLKAGVQNALKDAGWDKKAFEDRGGIFDWSRARGDLDRSNNLDW